MFVAIGADFGNSPYLCFMIPSDTICAVATAPGVGAIAVIRVSGPETFSIVQQLFPQKNLAKQAGHTLVYGMLRNKEELLDEVLLSLFRAPKSYTKEDTIEISTHGSPYIVRRILQALVQKGCRMANPGEFTQRAFLNGQLDLVQAEAVADLIAADSAAAHKVALTQLRGGFSKKLGQLREELVHFASLVELELDFGEEDVEFANRDDLRKLVVHLQDQIRPLIESFSQGNAVKEGIPVAILGAPNAGKSTLLNALLREEKAIVTDIAGTTRDVIEDVLFLGGIKFRILDTAGIRETQDVVEALGIERSRKAMEQAEVVLFLFDNEEDKAYLNELAKSLTSKFILWVRNKMDQHPQSLQPNEIGISAKLGEGIAELEQVLIEWAQNQQSGDTMLTNIRHLEQLTKTLQALQEVLEGLQLNVTGDFLAQDIRLALHHLGEITGTITTDDLLANIFSRFCIGK